MPTNLLKKETLAHVFSCKFFEIFKNAIFIEYIRAAASEKWNSVWLCLTNSSLLITMNKYDNIWIFLYFSLTDILFLFTWISILNYQAVRAVSNRRYCKRIVSNFYIAFLRSRCSKEQIFPRCRGIFWTLPSIFNELF